MIYARDSHGRFARNPKRAALHDQLKRELAPESSITIYADGAWPFLAKCTGLAIGGAAVGATIGALIKVSQMVGK